MASLPGPVSSATPVATVPEAGVRYPGLITRGISFALDAAVINLVAIVVGVGISLILSLLHLPSVLTTILEAVGAAAYILWLVGYFAICWSTTGQTPGARMMQIRVQTPDGGPISLGGALIRCIGVFLAALPLFLGFAPVLYDDRRRAFQDWLAGTVVVNAYAATMIETRRAQKREQYLAASRLPPNETQG